MTKDLSKIVVSIESKSEHKRWLDPYHIRCALRDYALNKEFCIADFRVIRIEKET